MACDQYSEPRLIPVSIVRIMLARVRCGLSAIAFWNDAPAPIISRVYPASSTHFLTAVLLDNSPPLSLLILRNPLF